MFDALQAVPQEKSTSASAIHSDNYAYASQNNTPHNRKFLILLATGSLEKVYNFNAIARLLGLPITFVSYKTLMSFHSTDEEKGNRLEHARDKQKELDLGIELIRKSPSHRLALEKLCAFFDIPFDEQNIYFATEDSSFSLIKKSWARARKYFAKYIPASILKNAEKDTDKDATGKNTYFGPGSELAPVLTAMGGVSNLMETALSGRDTENPDEAVQTMDASTLVIRRMDSSPLEPVKDFTGKHYHHILVTVKEAVKSKFRWHDSTTQRLASDEMPRSSFADDIRAFFTKYSSRTRVVEQLFEHINASPYEPPSTEKINEMEKRAATQITKNNRFNIRLMVGFIDLTSHKKHTQGFVSPAPKASTPHTQMMHTLDLSPNFSHQTDAFVYGPFDNKNLKTLRREAYKFFSSLDERLLEMESMGKPIVVANDGSYNSIIETYLYLVDTRMANDFDMLPEYEKDFKSPLKSKKNITGVAHKGFGLFDCIQSENDNKPASKERLSNGVNAILSERKRTYMPFIGIPIGKIPSPQKQNRRTDIFKVALFTSATSDNRVLLEENHRLCVGIGKQKGGVVWGGGDRHAMGAVYNACVQNGIYIEGFSPPSIIVAETKRAQMPQCNYSEISQNIFDRMAKMIEASDVITITPGGFGTLQEMLAVLILMHEQPELMKNKSLIIHNPHLYGETSEDKRFWNPIIRTFFGADALDKLLINPRTFARQNIYMTTSVSEHDKLIGQLKSKWEIDRKLAAAPPSHLRRPRKRRELAA